MTLKRCEVKAPTKVTESVTIFRLMTWRVQRDGLLASTRPSTNYKASNNVWATILRPAQGPRSAKGKGEGNVITTYITPGSLIAQALNRLGSTDRGMMSMRESFIVDPADALAQSERDLARRRLRGDVCGRDSIRSGSPVRRAHHGRREHDERGAAQ